jgi:hypothetical protein
VQGRHPTLPRAQTPRTRRGSNSDVNVARYRDVVTRRWRAFGARSVHFVDVDADEAHEGHAIVVSTASDVLIAFRGTSTPEGWAANAQLSPWQIATRGGQDLLNVHSGFLGSLIPILPRVGEAVSKVRTPANRPPNPGCRPLAPTPLRQIRNPPAAPFHLRTGTPPYRLAPQALKEGVADPSAARIFVSGHSRGGAHAMLAALALSDVGAKVAGVWTFSAPKVGKVSGRSPGPQEERPSQARSQGLGAPRIHLSFALTLPPCRQLTTQNYAPLKLRRSIRRTLCLATCAAWAT